MLNQDCEHNFMFQGIVYSHGDPMPGSGAMYRTYEDKYYCTKCLQVLYRNDRQISNSYQKPIEMSTPK